MPWHDHRVASDEEIALITATLMRVALFSVLCRLQWFIWYGDSSVSHYQKIRAVSMRLEKDNHELRAKNNLRQQAITARRAQAGRIDRDARWHLHMLGQDETLYLIRDAS